MEDKYPNIAQAYKSQYGKGGPLPPEAWAFFDGLNMLRPAEQSNSQSDLANAIWGLVVLASAAKNADKKRAFDVGLVILRTLSPEERESWYSKCQRDQGFDTLLFAHPEQRAIVRMGDKAAGTPSGIGLMLMHFQSQFETLPAWQRNFMSAQAAAGSNMAFTQGKQVMDVMRPETFTFMLAKQLIGAGQEDLSLQVLTASSKELGKEQFSNILEIPDSPDKHSYFELYTAAPRNEQGDRAPRLLKYLVDIEAYSDDSFEVFCQQQELADVTTFVVQFVTLARQKYFATGKPVEAAAPSDAQPKGCCGLGGSKKPAPVKATKAIAAPSKLLTAPIPHVLLRSLMATHYQRIQDRDLQRALELILLLNETQIVAQVDGEMQPLWVDPVHTDLGEEGREFLRKALTAWLESYYLLILDLNRPPAYKADATKIQRLLFKEELWTFTPTSHTEVDFEGRQVQKERKYYFQYDYRSSEEIALVLWRFFDVSMYVHPSLVFQLLVCALNLAALHQRPSLNILDKFLPVNGPLHTVVAMTVYNYLPRFPHADVQLLMQQPEFYTESIQGLLREGAMDKIQAVFTGTEGFSTLILAVQKLSRLEITGSSDIIHGDLDRSTWEMTLAHITNVVEGNPVCIELVSRMLTAVLQTHVRDEDFKPQDVSDMPSAFTLLHLLSCARRLRAACDSIKDDDIKRAFSKIILAFVALPPRQWVPLFNSVETVVFLLRFIGREELQLTYERFHAENQSLFAADSSMQDLLVEAQTIYSEPLINMKKNITELTTLDIRSKLAERKSKGAQSAPAGQRNFSNKDWDIIVDIATCAAESMKEKYSLPMLPHHTQLVTMLMFAIQLCLGPKDKSKPTTILARVGTGEGKSWIIGMLAAYVAKKGMTAHVAIDNPTLLERDFRTMSDLFRKLNINVHKGSFKPEYQIIYCSAIDIEMYFLDRISKGVSDVNFKNCAMIVDEVDSLIVDENAYQSYVFDDQGASDVCEWWYTEGQKADAKTIDKMTCEDWMKKIMKKMKAADVEASAKFEGQHFHVDDRDGSLFALDELTTMVKRNAWYLWLEALRKQRDPAHKIQYKCRQMVICQKSCFTSYSFIFGLTGSLGTEAELEYTKKHFHASCFFVPRFLDTCEGMTKPHPKCVQTVVGKDASSQLVRTTETVQQYVKNVPTIVVARNPERVKKIISALEKALPTHAKGDELGGGIIELLDMPGRELEFQQLVETATLPIDIEGSRQWRVTVTTAAGARGQDYQISDDAVDEKGGLLLLLEYIPDSEREWIQFLGRTARHDHPGQYAVILNREEYKDALGSDMPKEDGLVEKKVLGQINAVTAQKLGEAEKQLEKGTTMHAYTGKFWKWYTKSTVTVEEKLDKFFKWVDLCEDFPDLTLEKISKEFEALKTGIVEEVVTSEAKKVGDKVDLSAGKGKEKEKITVKEIEISSVAHTPGRCGSIFEMCLPQQCYPQDE